MSPKKTILVSQQLSGLLYLQYDITNDEAMHYFTNQLLGSWKVIPISLTMASGAGITSLHQRNNYIISIPVWRCLISIGIYIVKIKTILWSSGIHNENSYTEKEICPQETQMWRMRLFSRQYLSTWCRQQSDVIPSGTAFTIPYYF